MREIIKKGDTYGRLKAIKFVKRNKNGSQIWLFKCACSNKVISLVNEVKRKKRTGTKSCGCLAKETLLKMNKTHGMRKTRLYKIWVGMKTRCLNKNHTWFKHYGGRGIKVCSKWLSFIGFMEDMNKSYIAHVKKHGENNTSLDRIDGNKNYSIENCKWATKLEQSNNARNNIFIEYKGKNQSIKAWAKEIGVNYSTLYGRLFTHHLSLDEAMKKDRDFKNKLRK